MNPLPFVVAGLFGTEAVLILLRLWNVIAWRWWMLAPLWVGAPILIAEAAAVAVAVAVVRDILQWLLA